MSFASSLTPLRAGGAPSASSQTPRKPCEGMMLGMAAGFSGSQNRRKARIYCIDRALNTRNLAPDSQKLWMCLIDATQPLVHSLASEST
jgi:hypothetical protein